MNRNVDLNILAAWLNEKPAPALLEAWEHYIKALCCRLSADERRSLKEEVLTDARNIAQAAGGFLGFGKISDEEQNMLARLEAAFR